MLGQNKFLIHKRADDYGSFWGSNAVIPAGELKRLHAEDPHNGSYMPAPGVGESLSNVMKELSENTEKSSGAPGSPTTSNKPDNPKLNAQDYMTLAGILGGADRTLGLRRLADLGPALRRLDKYRQNSHDRNYNPIDDIKKVNSYINTREYMSNYYNWAANEANVNRPLYNQLASLYNTRHAINYAANNPNDFNDLTRFRNIGVWKYLTGSVKDNEKLLRLLKTPMTGFLNKDQQSKVTRYLWLMDVIMRVKRFFSGLGLGNWFNKMTTVPAVAK